MCQGGGVNDSDEYAVEKGDAKDFALWKVGGSDHSLGHVARRANGWSDPSRRPTLWLRDG